MRFTYEHDESLSDDAQAIIAYNEGRIEWPFQDGNIVRAFHFTNPAMNYATRMAIIQLRADNLIQTYL